MDSDHRSHRRTCDHHSLFPEQLFDLPEMVAGTDFLPPLGVLYLAALLGSLVPGRTTQTALSSLISSKRRRRPPMKIALLAVAALVVLYYLCGGIAAVKEEWRYAKARRKSKVARLIRVPWWFIRDMLMFLLAIIGVAILLFGEWLPCAIVWIWNNGAPLRPRRHTIVP